MLFVIIVYCVVMLIANVHMWRPVFTVICQEMWWNSENIWQYKVLLWGKFENSVLVKYIQNSVVPQVWHLVKN